MSTRVAAAWSPLVSPPFLICLVLLGAAAILSGPMAQRWRKVFIKEPIQCRKPLDEMRRNAFGPYGVINDDRLQASIVQALGTEKYISWVLKDTRREETDPRYLVHLTVTYYTGGHNLVPHTPDVCMVASGYKLTKASNETVHISALGPAGAAIPVRVCTFMKSEVYDRSTPTVVYMFHCNGDFVCTRTAVRIRTTNPSDRYAYFSKVELSFSDSTRMQTPTRHAALTAAQEFCEYLLPVLVDEHWPDWHAVDAEGDTAGGEPAGTAPA